MTRNGIRAQLVDSPGNVNKVHTSVSMYNFLSTWFEIECGKDVYMLGDV